MKLNQLRKAELLHLIEGLIGEENIEQMLEENDKCLDCKIILRKLSQQAPAKS